MATISSTIETMADLLEQLHIPPERILLRPPPGEATEVDLLKTPRLCELIDGVLVEKAVGLRGSFLAVDLGRFVGNFVDERDLGICTGADGAVRLMPRLVRIPDFSVILWDRLPNHEVPNDPIPDLAPYLAVEVLSENNTKGEMERKLRDYFATGVELVWYVDPETRSVAVFTSLKDRVLLLEADTLEGGSVLPGFRLPLKKLFAKLSQQPRQRRGKGRNGRAS